MNTPKATEAAAARQSSLKKHTAYSLAAGAAVAVPTGDADAAIVHLADQNFDVVLGLGGYPINIDADVYADITLKNYVFLGGYYQGLTVGFAPGRVIGFEMNTPSGPINYVSLLNEGDPINPSTASPSGAPDLAFFGVLSYGTNNPNDEFDNVQGGLIGFSFPIGGATEADLHYAWMRLDVDNAAGTLKILEWAYEDVPGVGILAGDTGGSGVPGDFDADGDVDVADALEGQRNGEDLTAGADWSDNFGLGSFAPPVAAVPEPGTLGLLAAGSLGVSQLRRTRRRRV